MGEYMNDNMHTMIVVDALAIMSIHGMVKAVQYMVANGFSTTEAFAVVDMYDRALNRVLSGQLP